MLGPEDSRALAKAIQPPARVSLEERVEIVLAAEKASSLSDMPEWMQSLVRDSVDRVPESDPVKGDPRVRQDGGTVIVSPDEGPRTPPEFEEVQEEVGQQTLAEVDAVRAEQYGRQMESGEPTTYGQITAGTAVLSALVSNDSIVALELNWRSVGVFFRIDEAWETAGPEEALEASIHTINPDRAIEFIDLWDTEDSELMRRLPEFEATPTQYETLHPAMKVRPSPTEHNHSAGELEVAEPATDESAPLDTSWLITRVPRL